MNRNGIPVNFGDVPAEAKKAAPVLLLFGPTASGKTEILEQLFTSSCPLCRAEVVSADSMQVYRGMDLGTAKPSKELLSRLPHHLIDIRDIKEQFNAGEFVRMADEAIPDIRRRGALPVVSGGTGFYLANFVTGLPETPLSDALIRAALREELREKGAAVLMEELAAGDPVSAGRIHPHDEYRLLRALEVLRLTGRPLSSYFRPGFSENAGDVTSDNRFRPDYRFLLVALDRPRAEVYLRIDGRCDAMFRMGLPGEVKRLWESGYGPGDPGMKAIGYREFFMEDGKGGFRLAEDTEAVKDLVARNSRRYAKRQLTFFASLPQVHWVPAGKDAAARIGELVKRELLNTP
ncbi:MAG: tRNA (adenosine(37)-N6)-dimethylallyltransferase MiaA [Treponema sp.]|jgi:tRNA dimethylallyltransferase|nr:tRNA (adenosine(37)-N6)-dimethylallyltransferase MiaA [Treponema sp.]